MFSSNPFERREGTNRLFKHLNNIHETENAREDKSGESLHTSVAINLERVCGYQRISHAYWPIVINCFFSPLK